MTVMTMKGNPGAVAVRTTARFTGASPDASAFAPAAARAGPRGRRIGHGRALPRAALLGLLLVLASSILPSHAAVKNWRGSLLSFHWSNPDNWDPRGVPQNGVIIDPSGVGGF